MSSTNRGAERSASDFYPTPADTTRALLTWAERNGLMGDVMRVLDPCAGDGAILREVKKRYSLDTIGVEIREGCVADLEMAGVGRVITGDALTLRSDDWNRIRPPDCAVITNPPFSLAREFVDTYRFVGLWSAFLLRLGFLASQKRAPWWVGHPPAHILVLPQRPSFTGDGKTDSADYCWIVWRGRTEPGATRLDWLG